MARLRRDFLAGTLSVTATNVATSLSSAAFANLPVVAGSDHMMLVLDPTGSAGAPEIVKVTAHTSSATTVTVVRAQEGTTARQHLSGATWRHTATSVDLGLGVLGYAQVVAAQGSITSEVDATGLSVTVTVGAGRRIRVTGHGAVYSSVGWDTVRMSVKEGATLLNLAQAAVSEVSVAATLDPVVILTPTAAAHTYKLTVQRANGTGNITLDAAATYPAFILVEDIGAA